MKGVGNEDDDMVASVDGIMPKEDVMKLEAKKQLMAWYIQTEIPANLATGEWKNSYAGKSPNVKDDLAGAWQLCVLWANTYIENECMRARGFNEKQIKQANQANNRKRTR